MVQQDGFGRRNRGFTGRLEALRKIAHVVKLGRRREEVVGRPGKRCRRNLCDNTLPVNDHDTIGPHAEEAILLACRSLNSRRLLELRSRRLVRRAIVSCVIYSRP